MCSKETHRTLNSWLYYVVIHHYCNTYFRMMPFFCIHISQVSVATCLKRGGMFKYEFVANLLPSRLVKNFENRIIVKLWPRVWCLVFFDSRCTNSKYHGVSIHAISNDLG